MKAMIFAAGLGTRLQPLTGKMPKALVPVSGKPLLEHVIEKLKDAGFDEIIVNVHHFSGQVVRFLAEKNNFGIRIEISDETDLLLDTGGGIKKAVAFFDDEKPFLVHNVDIFSNADLHKIYDFALKSNALATLLVSKRQSSRYLLFDKNRRLAGWLNDTTGEVKSPYKNLNINDCEKLAFGGIHVVSPGIFKLMDTWTGKFSIIEFYLSVCDKHEICAYMPENLKLLDVGKMDSLGIAEKFLQGKQG